MPVEAPRPARHLEVERKFDVIESTVSPSFEGIAAVVRVEQSPTQQLDAVYFDTPSHDLARNQITLRRRTGGADAGWHLKLPAGPDKRTEMRAPLSASGDAVPAELLDVVLAIVRDQPVQPVARISTHRESQILYGAGGDALAEFCNDDVTAWSAGAFHAAGAADNGPAEQQWREWELELVTTDGTADTKLLDRLANRLLDAGAAPAGHGSKLARVLGATSPGELPNGPQPPADPVHRAVSEQVEQLLLWDRAVRADAYDAVHQMRVTTRKIRSLLTDSQESFGLKESAWVIDELRELANVLGVARDARYSVSQEAKVIQTLLGDHQDSVVSREHLIQQAIAANTAGEDTFTYGLLYQQEADLAERCREQLEAALRKLDKAVRKARD